MTRALSALEGEYRLVRIIKIKNVFYIVQAITILALIVLLMMFLGASLKPLYIPISNIIFFVLLTVIAFTIANFLFRILEIKYNVSNSRKFLMAKNSQKKGIIFLIISALIAVILMLPVTGDAFESALQDSEIEMGFNNNVEAFNSRDPFGLTTIKTITLTNLDENSDIQVYVLEKQDYEEYRAGNTAILNLAYNNFWSTVSDENEFTFDVDEFKEFVIFLMTDDNIDAKALVQMNVVISDDFTFFTPLLLFAFAGANAGWYAYLQPTKSKYAKDSIYK